ncbi:DUF6123 family protein [Pseudalkalibacillus sp. R45]|uniref:DUF6123 family protein n=1 Tax=Pseudalkalibacillus sp. R45 TaxID=3457433 RepID=UPI003FCD31DA
MHIDSTGNYIEFLSSKGIHLTENHIAFIYFGKKYTDSDEEVVNVAIETTLKVQVKFEGSYYIALLETMKQAGVENYFEAKRFVRKNRIVPKTLHKEKQPQNSI